VTPILWFLLGVLSTLAVQMLMIIVTVYPYVVRGVRRKRREGES